MKFVARNVQGEIVCVYSRRRPGVADEQVADDHPQVLAIAAGRGSAAAIERAQREEAAQKAETIRAEAVDVLLEELAADNPRAAEIRGRLEAAKSYQRGEPVR